VVDPRVVLQLRVQYCGERLEEACDREPRAYLVGSQPLDVVVHTPSLGVANLHYPNLKIQLDDTTEC
jgi:hypothetical protein